MAQTPDKLPPPIYWLNVMFWQLAGVMIGGLAPTAAVAIVYTFASDNTWNEWFWIAACTAPFTATAGGIIGVIVGFYDKRLPFAERKITASGPQPTAAGQSTLPS